MKFHLTAVTAIILIVGCDSYFMKPVPNGQQQRIEMIQKVVSESYKNAALHLDAYPERAEMCKRNIPSADKLSDVVAKAGSLSGEMEAVTTKLIIATMVAHGNSLVEEADRDIARKSGYAYAIQSLANGAIEVERLASYNPSWSKFSPGRN